MIAAFFQLYHCSTVVAPLPPCIFSCRQESIRLLIFRAVLLSMPFSVTKTADLCFTTTTFAVFSTIFLVYISGFDPFPTPSSWTVYSIFGRVLLELFVPGFLEIDIKKPVYML